MKKVLFLCVLITILCHSTSCKKTAKLSFPAVKAAIVTVKNVKPSKSLLQRFSVFSAERQTQLFKVLDDHPNLVPFLEKNPNFLTQWDHLYSHIPSKAVDESFLKIFIHADDYAKYGGNKIQNYIFQEGASGDILILGKESKRLLAKIKPGKVVEISSKDVNNWFAQLKPLASCIYVIDGAKYTIDDFGRVAKTEFKITPQSLIKQSVRDNGVQRWCTKLKQGKENDHAGHLIADEFGGSSNMINLIPMTSNVNKSVYRSIEAKWKKLAKDGKTVNVEIKPIYATNNVERPSWFNIKYECDDLKVVENIENS